jgi:hypothetical protein
MVNLIEESSPKPESNLNFQVDRTPGGLFVKGQSGNPADKRRGAEVTNGRFDRRKFTEA